MAELKRFQTSANLVALPEIQGVIRGAAAAHLPSLQPLTFAEVTQYYSIRVASALHKHDPGRGRLTTLASAVCKRARLDLRRRAASQKRRWREISGDVGLLAEVPFRPADRPDYEPESLADWLAGWYRDACRRERAIGGLPTTPSRAQIAAVIVLQMHLGITTERVAALLFVRPDLRRAIGMNANGPAAESVSTRNETCIARSISRGASAAAQARGSDLIVDRVAADATLCCG